MITDTNGNQLAGARITAAVNGKALGAKAAHSVTVETVANGHFTIPNVPVVNTVNPNGTTTGGALTLSIEAPAGYFGATALVFPQAQAVSTEVGGLQQGDGNPVLVWFDHFNADAGTIPLPATIATITGTLRSGTTGEGITGFPMRLTFEQVQPDQFGQGTVECADGSDCPSPVTSVVVSYASGNEQRIVTEGTGTGQVPGRFFFTNVPADSCVRIYAPGLNFVDVTGGTGQDFGGAVCDDQDDALSVSYIAVSTNDDFVQLNAVLATSSPNGDTIPPIVSSVNNAVVTNGGCIGQNSFSASFTSAQGNVITVNFSEPVNIDTDLLVGNPVVVLIGNPPNVTTATVTGAVEGADGRSLVITLSQPLPQGSQVRVQIPVEAVADLSGNLLADRPGFFDSLVQTVNNGSIENQVLSLCFNVFSPNVTPGQIAVTQVDDVVNENTLLFQSSHALADFVVTNEPDHGTFNQNDAPVGIPAFAGIDQLNGPDQDASTIPLSPDPSDELTGLATAFSGLVNPTAATTVINTTARVHVDNVDDATTVLIALQNPVNQRAKDVGFWVVNTGSGDPQVIGVVCPNAGACPNPKQLPLAVSNGGKHWYVIAVNGATDFDVVIAGADTSGAFSENVSNGDLVHVIARDSNKTLVSTADVAVLDNVVPGVGLQLLGNANGVVSLNEFGEGGTVVITGTTNTGIVVLPITPQIADKIDPGTGCGVANGTVAGYSSDDYHDETFLPSGLNANGFSDSFLTDSAGNCRADTDATGMAAFLGAGGATRNDVTAIAVTEEVALHGAAASPIYSGNATLGTISIHNHTPTENFVGTSNDTATSGAIRDLVEFNVNNVMTLQADARNNANQIISLNGLIEDTTAGNVADETAHVLLRDKFPPMPVLAFFDGTNIVIVFNEPILLDGRVVFECQGGAQSVALDFVTNNPAVTAISLNAGTIGTFAAGQVLTIPANNFAAQNGGAQVGACFSNGLTFDEAAYSNLATGLTDLATIAVPQRHGFISTLGVPDSQGNVWDCGNPVGQGTSGPLCNGVIAGNPVTFSWANARASGQPLGIGGPHFAMADILGPFQPDEVLRSGNYISTGPNQGQAGQTVDVTLHFTHPFFLFQPGAAGTNCGGPQFPAEVGPLSADNGLGGGIACDKVLTNGELLAWGNAKFVYEAEPGGIFYPLTAIHIFDANGTDVSVAGSDPQTAVTIVLTFQLGAAVQDGDRIHIVAGQGLESNLDPTQHVFPVDFGVGGEPNSEPNEVVGDGLNQINELQSIAPDVVITCPQDEVFPNDPVSADLTQC